MGILITVARPGVPQQEPPKRVEKTVTLERFIASLPGNSGKTDKSLAYQSATMELKRIELAFNRKLKFIVDHESHEVMVKVIDPDTDKVIKILPPEEIQLLNRHINKIDGFLFDERV